MNQVFNFFQKLSECCNSALNENEDNLFHDITQGLNLDDIYKNELEYCKNKKNHKKLTQKQKKDADIPNVQGDLANQITSDVKESICLDLKPPRVKKKSIEPQKNLTSIQNQQLAEMIEILPKFLDDCTENCKLSNEENFELSNEENSELNNEENFELSNEENCELSSKENCESPKYSSFHSFIDILKKSTLYFQRSPLRNFNKENGSSNEHKRKLPTKLNKGNLTLKKLNSCNNWKDISKENKEYEKLLRGIYSACKRLQTVFDTENSDYEDAMDSINKEEELKNNAMNCTNEKETTKNNGVDCSNEKETTKNNGVDCTNEKEAMKNKIMDYTNEKEIIKNNTVFYTNEKEKIENNIVVCTNEKEKIENNTMDCTSVKETIIHNTMDCTNEKETIKKDIQSMGNLKKKDLQTIQTIHDVDINEIRADQFISTVTSRNELSINANLNNIQPNSDLNPPNTSEIIIKTNVKNETPNFVNFRDIKDNSLRDCNIISTYEQENQVGINSRSLDPFYNKNISKQLDGKINLQKFMCRSKNVKLPKLKLLNTFVIKTNRRIQTESHFNENVASIYKFINRQQTEKTHIISMFNNISLKQEFGNQREQQSSNLQIQSSVNEKYMKDYPKIVNNFRNGHSNFLKYNSKKPLSLPAYNTLCLPTYNRLSLPHLFFNVENNTSKERNCTPIYKPSIQKLKLLPKDFEHDISKTNFDGSKLDNKKISSANIVSNNSKILNNPNDYSKSRQGSFYNDHRRQNRSMLSCSNNKLKSICQPPKTLVPSSKIQRKIMKQNVTSDLTKSRASLKSDTLIQRENHLKPRRQQKKIKISIKIRKPCRPVVSMSDLISHKKEMEARASTLVTPRYLKKFRTFAKDHNRKKSGLVIGKRQSNRWLKKTGMLDDGQFSCSFIDNYFTSFAGKRLVINAYDYMLYLVRLAWKAGIETKLLYERMLACDPPDIYETSKVKAYESAVVLK